LHCVFSKELELFVSFLVPSFACLPVSKQPIQLVQFFVSFSLRSGNDIFTRDA